MANVSDQMSQKLVARLDTDYSLCIICQSAGGLLVENPTTHDKVLQAIRERAQYGDSNYPELSRRLGDLQSPDLVSNR